MRKLKLFSLALMALFSMNVWSEDPETVTGINTLFASYTTRAIVVGTPSGTTYVDNVYLANNGNVSTIKNASTKLSNGAVVFYLKKEAVVKFTFLGGSSNTSATIKGHDFLISENTTTDGKTPEVFRAYTLMAGQASSCSDWLNANGSTLCADGTTTFYTFFGTTIGMTTKDGKIKSESKVYNLFTSISGDYYSKCFAANTDHDGSVTGVNDSQEKDFEVTLTKGYYAFNLSTSNSIGLKSISFSSAADETAPAFTSSTPANGATGVATSGTIVLAFDEAVASVDATKFSLSGATLGAVAIDGTDAKNINVAYSGADELEVVTLSVAAEAVADAAGNKSAALSDISFTTDGTCTNPTITTDLSTTLVEYLKDADATPLAIVATGKSLTYQWYSNTTNSTEGATSLGETARSASYTPSTATVGTTYYYCVVSSGDCSTTSAFAQIKVSYARTTGWVIYDGMTDESFTSGSIEYNSVTVNYTVVGNSMLSASDLANRNKNNDFNDYTYPNAVKIEKHNPAAETPVIAYVSFTIPTGYQATKIILAVGVAGGSRDIVLAKSAVTTVESTDVITHFEQGGKSDRIYDATYTPASAIAAGTYYILTPVGGSWNIFHLQLLVESSSATALDNTEAGVKAVKVLRDGQLLIEKNGHVYNVLGGCVK